MPAKPIIPNFTVIEYCGSGAYGDVWIGEDRDGVRRAIKVLDKKRLQSLGALIREEKAVKLFRTLTKRHPHLIEIFAVGETDEYIYHVMELADAAYDAEKEYVPDSLSERLKTGNPIPLDELCAIMEQVLSAVEHLHASGLLHRDIKPSNVVFVDKCAKLADMGLVSSSNSDMSVVGSLGFFPLNEKMSVSSDVYALGKLLYCMCTGNTVDDFPSPPDYSDTPETMRQMKMINKAILKACDEKQENRFQCIDEFRQALRGEKLKTGKLNPLIVLATLVLIALPLIGYAFHLHLLSKEIPLSLLDATAKEQSGKTLEAIKITTVILKKDAKNEETLRLRKRLIEKFVSSKTSKPSTKNTLIKPLKTSKEKKLFAACLLLYQSHMAKNEPEKALKCLDAINKKWPDRKNSKPLLSLRQHALRKIKKKNKVK